MFNDAWGERDGGRIGGSWPSKGGAGLPAKSEGRGSDLSLAVSSGVRGPGYCDEIVLTEEAVVPEVVSEVSSGGVCPCPGVR